MQYSDIERCNFNLSNIVRCNCNLAMREVKCIAVHFGVCSLLTREEVAESKHEGAHILGGGQTNKQTKEISFKIKQKQHNKKQTFKKSTHIGTYWL